MFSFGFSRFCYFWRSWIRHFLALTSLLMLTFLLARWWTAWPAPVAPPPMTIEQIQALAELVTARVHVSDVRECRIDGFTGGTRVLLVVRGEILLGVDLEQARFAGNDAARRSSTLLLPEPRVTSVRLDHQGTRITSMGPHGLWVIVPWRTKDQQLINRAYQEAQAALEAAADDPDLPQHGKAHAEAVLHRFATAMSWQLHIQWAPSK
jgi:hypothetical protein